MAGRIVSIMCRLAPGVSGRQNLSLGVISEARRMSQRITYQGQVAITIIGVIRSLTERIRLGEHLIMVVERPTRHLAEGVSLADDVAPGIVFQHPGVPETVGNDLAMIC